MDLKPIISYQFIELLKEFKEIFAFIYKDLKGIPFDVAQHWIELDTSIPLAHQTRYRLNPNYATIIKQDIDKLLVASLLKILKRLLGYHLYLYCLRKNGKLKICVDFTKLNVATNKDPYLLPFTNELTNIIARHEVYTFLDGFS